MPPNQSPVLFAPAIGQGVHVAPSTIAAHGLGLYASRSFDMREVVTWYDGFALPKELLWSEHVLYQPGSHTLTLDGSPFAVQGLQHPIEGWGGGAFINHRPPDLANCEYTILSHNQHRLRYSLPSCDIDTAKLPMCIIRATRNIVSNEELFCDYTFETCAILGIFYDHLSYRNK